MHDPAWWKIAIVAFGALGAAMLTFFSGFGLGTLLMPVLAFFVPAPVAIGATAIVHLANNLFMLAIIGRKLDWRVLARFGLAATPMAFLGAWILTSVAHGRPLASYQLGQRTCEITPVKLLLAGLIGVFAVMELSPRFSKLQLERKWLPLGGALSGFFGGLSGHQGALRSAFLVRSGLNKESLIATGVVIGCIIDVTRLSVYGLMKGQDADELVAPRTLWLVGPACVAALIGALVGAQLLKKVTLKGVRMSVGVMLVVVALLMAGGVV